MKSTKNTTYGSRLIILFLIIIASSFNSTAQSRSYNYAVVCSESAYSENGWKTVADSLVKKHAANGVSRLFKWKTQVGETKTALGEFNPDYVAFVAKPVTECNSSFVVAVHRLCRTLDSDPYGDAIWGIITGFRADDALRALTESLLIKTVFAASGNLSYEPPIQRFYQAIGMTCDSYTKTDYLFNGNRGNIYSENKRPDNEQDRIKIVSKWLNSESLNISIPGKGNINASVDCIITGGHGNINLWQCHYPDAGTEGYMQSSGGKLFGTPYSGSKIDINAQTPKVYWCASNCLMGNPDSKDNIVYGAFGSGHAVQMFGFMNNASAGDEFMAWGVYDRVTKRAGTLTLPQGYFLSNNNALFEIRNPGNLINTRLVQPFMDSTVFYGDPAANVQFYGYGDSAHAFKEVLSMSASSDGLTEFTYTYTMLAHDLEYGEGYCYQFRPASFLPVRIDPSTVTIVRNDGHKCEITDNLMIWEMLSKGEKLNKGLSKTLTWRAKVTDTKTITGIRAQVPEKSKTKEKILFERNATSNTILMSGLSDGTYLLLVTDLRGKVCFEKTFSHSGKSSADVQFEKKLPVGVYFVKVKKLSENGSLLSMVKF